MNRDDTLKSNIKWVQPVMSPSLIKRSHVIDEIPDMSVAKMNMFDEIFPEKKKKSIESKGNEYWDTNDTFHRAMMPILFIGQCFGVMPVAGILSPRASDLKFVWFSWRIGFALICISGSGFMSVMCLHHMVIDGVDLYKIINFVFFASAFTALVLFLRLAPRWPKLVSSITTQERANKLHRRSLRTRLKICCFAVLFPALVEHILAVSAGIAVAYDCSFGRPLIKAYFVNCYPQIFSFSDYAVWKGIILQWINLESAFNWNFMDLFIIVISVTLTDRFNQLNKRLEAVKGKNLPEQFWKTAREEYAHLSRLVRKVDSVINEIVLLSFANNLYFICVQLFNSLKNAHEDKVKDNCGESKLGQLRALLNLIYFGFSFGLLVTRSLMVSLEAARIHSAARQPAATLYAAPSSSYGNETQRFLEQVVTDEVALTGLNFFNVTRGLVLTIAGTIVTYELVLVQFNSIQPPITVNTTINENCSIPLKIE